MYNMRKVIMLQVSIVIVQHIYTVLLSEKL